MQSRWMILGGAGVFGVHLAGYLLEHGAARVVCVGRNPWPASPFTLDVGRSDPRFHYEQVHIFHESPRLFRLMEQERPDVIVNFAAQAYATSWEESELYYQTNVTALVRICEWLMGKKWLDRFIQIGTSELYGSVTAPATEDFPLLPTSPYAVSKLAADMHLQTLTPRGFPAIILRPSNAYGEAQQLYRVVPGASWCAVQGKKFPLQGGGVVRKSYLHARDLASAVAVVAECGQVGRVYNCGPEHPVTIRALVENVARVAHVPADELIALAPRREGEDACYWLNSDRIRKIGWNPLVDLDDGIARVIHWVRRNMNILPTERPEFVLRT